MSIPLMKYSFCVGYFWSFAVLPGIWQSALYDAFFMMCTLGEWMND